MSEGVADRATGEGEPVPRSGRGSLGAVVTLLARGLGFSEGRHLTATLVFVWPHWRLAGGALFASVVAAALEGGALTIFALAVQALIGEEGVLFADAFGTFGAIFDSLVGNLSRTGMFFALVGMAVALTGARGALRFGAEIASSVVYVRVFRAVWHGLFRQFMTMSYGGISAYRLGDLSQYIWDAKNIHSLIWQSNQLFSVVLVAAAYLAVMVWLSWQMTILAIVAMAILIVGLRGLTRRLHEAAERFVPARVEMATRTTEYLEAGRDVRLFGLEERAEREVEQSLGVAMTETRRRMILRSSIRPAMETLAVAGVAMFLVAGWWVMGGLDQSATLPRLLTFIVIIYRFLPQAGSINQHRATIIDLAPVSRRVIEMLRTDNKEYLPDGETAFAGLTDEVRFENVTLRYVEDERPALDGITFDIPAGRMTALVGISGAGKSTAADLLSRLYDPTSGRIAADGRDLRDLRVATWRSAIGVVSQEPHIFNASIADNISIGLEGSTRAQVEAAAGSAMVDEFVSRLHDGYETVLGDRGYRLSGGQRQRVAIARALIRQPEILVFDEATSSLDTESERMIVQAVEHMRRDRTLLVIAHRLSTITRADQIVVLEEGHVAERGTHDELVSQNGRYAALWRLQSEESPNSGAEG